MQDMKCSTSRCLARCSYWALPVKHLFRKKDTPRLHKCGVDPSTCLHRWTHRRKGRTSLSLHQTRGRLNQKVWSVWFGSLSHCTLSNENATFLQFHAPFPISLQVLTPGSNGHMAHLNKFLSLPFYVDPHQNLYYFHIHSPTRFC